MVLLVAVLGEVDLPTMAELVLPRNFQAVASRTK